MWTKQRQRHDFDDSVDCQPSKTKTPYQYDNSWEEQAFAEDAAGGLGGCVWPPRSYSCSFCRREFRSAQALGGHMNVHRRDRARLKQSPNPQTPFTSLGFQCSSQQLLTSVAFDVPNPRTYPSYSGFRTFLSCTSPATDELNRQPTDVISCSQSDPKTEKDEKTILSDPRVRDKDHVRTGFSDEGLNLSFRQPRPTSAMSNGWEEAATGCKRRKTDDETSIQFYVKSSSLVERHHHHHHHIQSEVIGLSSSSIHDLDLELRLGGFSKVE